MMSGRCVAWATTMANTSSDTGFLLHSRPFRDTSLIADFFLRDHGRVSVLFKGVRASGKQGAKARLLQPFSPLLVRFQGRNELRTGLQVEPAQNGFGLTGSQLYSGLYLNELLVRLLYKEEPSIALYDYYWQALVNLQCGALEPTLRIFEHQLLAELGYELDLHLDSSGEPIHSQRLYLYQPDQGFGAIAVRPRHGDFSVRCFSGAELLAIQRNEYEDNDVLKAAKRLSRLALQPHLGDKPLRSRELFTQLRQS